MNNYYDKINKNYTLPKFCRDKLNSRIYNIVIVQIEKQKII